jgi:hypothetical protein
MTNAAENGIVTTPGHRSVDQTVEKLLGILKTKDIKLFALIDHNIAAVEVLANSAAE